MGGDRGREIGQRRNEEKEMRWLWTGGGVFRAVQGCLHAQSRGHTAQASSIGIPDFFLGTKKPLLRLLSRKKIPQGEQHADALALKRDSCDLRLPGFERFM